jgi:hypothetical protein
VKDSCTGDELAVIDNYQGLVFWFRGWAWGQKTEVIRYVTNCHKGLSCEQIILRTRSKCVRLWKRRSTIGFRNGSMDFRFSRRWICPDISAFLTCWT